MTHFQKGDIVSWRDYEARIHVNATCAARNDMEAEKRFKTLCKMIEELPWNTVDAELVDVEVTDGY